MTQLFHHKSNMKVLDIDWFQTLVYADDNEVIEACIKSWCEANNIAMVYVSPESFDMSIRSAFAIVVSPRSCANYRDFQKESVVLIPDEDHGDRINPHFVFKTDEYTDEDLLLELNKWIATVDEFLNTKVINPNDLSLLYKSQSELKNTWDRTILYYAAQNVLEERLIDWCRVNRKDLYKGEINSNDYYGLSGFVIIYDFDYIDEDSWKSYIKMNEAIDNEPSIEPFAEVEKKQIHINIKNLSHEEIIERLNKIIKAQVLSLNN